MRAERLQWFAVRCCCDGSRVVGFLRLPVDAGPEVTIFERPGPLPLDDPHADLLNITRHTIRLRHFGHERAVYSEDRPVEFWRGIAGFVEART